MKKSLFILCILFAFKGTSVLSQSVDSISINKITTDSLCVQFRALDTVSVSFQVFDRWGKTLKSFSYNGLQAKGFHKLCFLTDTLAGGTYYYVFTYTGGILKGFFQDIRNTSVFSTQIAAQTIKCSGTKAAVSASGLNGQKPYKYKWSNGDTLSSVFLSAGIYSITVTDSKAATASAALQLTEPSKIEVLKTISADSVSLAIKGGNAPYTCLWNTGTTGETLHNLMKGNYQVTITDSNGCSVRDSLYFEGVPLSQVSILNNNITIYPNPNNGILHIDCGFAADKMELFSLEGQKVWSGKAAPTLDISVFEKGIYALHISNRERKLILKIVKQ